MDLKDIEGLSDEQIKAIQGIIATSTQKLEEKNAELIAARRDIQAHREQLKKELEELKKWKAEVEEKRLSDEGDHKSALERQEKRYQTQLEKEQGEKLELRTQLEAIVLDKGISDGLDQLKVIPEHKRFLVPYFRGQAKIEDGKGFIGDDPLQEALSTWAGSDEAKLYIAAPMNGGGGANGGSHGNRGGEANPFDPKTRDLTEQSRLINTDRQRAVNLANQAGVKIRGLNT